jgi:hypothetical protein
VAALRAALCCVRVLAQWCDAALRGDATHGKRAERACARVPRLRVPRRVQMGPGGMDALIRLGCGDMRRTLNILQGCCGVGARHCLTSKLSGRPP